MVGHVVSTGEMKNACRFWEGTLKGRDHFRNLGNGRRCNETESERNMDGMVRTGLP
jgi:hypothetical protein